MSKKPNNQDGRQANRKGPSNIFKKNKNLAILLFALGAGLLGGSFASAPLYNLFCKVTGFGGTTQVASGVDGANGAVGEKNITAQQQEAIKAFPPVTVSFDSTIAASVPIDVSINPRHVSIPLNKVTHIIYRVTNKSDKTLAITSSYNATPNYFGRYIQKIECFCFTRQVLLPHETRDFRLVFFLSPTLAFAEDSQKLREMTLGYHFYLAKPE